MRAVILAGGRGRRLAPYTRILPKPLVPLGDMPILEVIIRQLERSGISEITLAVGHLANLLQAFFGDGTRLGVHITYAWEEHPLGTAGPLAAIERPSRTFLTMNGDVLTMLDYDRLVAYHQERRAVATIAMHRRSAAIDLGVIRCDGQNHVLEYIEKPTQELTVSMGIYVFEPRVLDYIPAGQRLDFPDLARRLIAVGERVVGFPYDGYWQDLGRPDDYEQAALDFESMRGQFLPEEVKDVVAPSPL